MHINQLTESIAQAPLGALDDLSRIVWDNLANGSLTDSEAQTLAEAIQRRRNEARAKTATPPESASEASGTPSRATPRAWSYFPPKRVPRSPNRARSIERRRTLAASAPLPPSLASKLTVGEQAVMRVVRDACGATGTCVLSVGEIASRAGVCVTKARTALRIAASLGLIVSTERRVPYKPNLPNVVKIACREWLAWIARTTPRKPSARPAPIQREEARQTMAMGSREGSEKRTPRNHRFTR